MKELAIKEMMEQIHISGEMQERIIAELQNGLQNGKGRKQNWRWIAVFAAVFLLGAGLISIPVQAIIRDAVRARMESISEEEIADMDHRMQEQRTEADSFSREFTAAEAERCHELWRAYKKGMFPQESIRRVETPEAVIEGELCYVWPTGEFYLPERELTDEELLEIIDFQHEMSYVVSESQAAKKARAQGTAEQAWLKARLTLAGGISEEQALEAAKDYMRARIGDEVRYMLPEQIRLKEQEGRIVYFIVYRNADKSVRFFLEIDSGDGSILKEM